MAEITKTWICDHCGQQINSIEEGWVQWLNIEDKETHGYYSDGLQLVHASQSTQRERRCIYDSDFVYDTRKATTADLSLKDFACPDGMMRLLSYISDDKFKDREQVLELVKRLFVPGYEHIRLHLEDAAFEGVFDPRLGDRYPNQNQIEEVQNWLKQSDSC